jgi:RHS repeat-associated protein
MPTSTYTYNLDGAMTTASGGNTAAGGNTASGEPFTSIRRHDYTRLPTVVVGSGGDLALRYDSQGKRLQKSAAQTVLYRNGVSGADALVEHIATDEIIYLFTPAGQTVTRRSNGYVRVASDHLTSVRTEVSAETYLPLATCHLPFATAAAVVTAHYSAYGKAIITGGTLRYAFTGYEWDAETALYNARRRLYSPALRLFVSVDPRLQDASPYPYCDSDPFNHTDPTGGSVAAIIGGIVQALIIIGTMVITCATDGVGALLFAPEADASATGMAMTTILGESAESEALAGASAASTVGSTVLKAAAIGLVGTAASNGVNLITKAAQGEHITAWQAVKSMIIEPIIAAAASAAAGTILLGGTLKGMLPELAAVLSSLTYSAVSSIGTAAVNNQLSTRGDWENIGIQMAMAVGEAALIESAYYLKVLKSFYKFRANRYARVFVKIEDWQGAHYINDPDWSVHPSQRQIEAVQTLVEAKKIEKNEYVAFAYHGEMMTGMSVEAETERGKISSGYKLRHPDKFGAYDAAKIRVRDAAAELRSSISRYGGMGGQFLNN